MKHPMTPHADADDPDYEAALETAQKLAGDNPMPDELKEQIGHWIEPQTVDTQTDHADVMDCIEIAFPLIRDWLAEQAAAAEPCDGRLHPDFADGADIRCELPSGHEIHRNGDREWLP